MKANAKLVITDLTWNAGDQPKPATPITFSVAVKNEGPEVLPADVKQTTIKVFIDRTELPEIKYNGEIALGETKVFESVVWEATEGNHVITATVDFAVPSPDNYGTGVSFTKNLRVAENALEVPAVAAAVGMNTLTFSDDFTTLDTIDVDATGNIGYKWYPTRPYGATTLKPTDYEITENGILLKEEKSTFNYGLCMLDIRTGAGWGYTHGYMEAKFRMPRVRLTKEGKGSPAIWALPPDKLWCRCNDWVEFDHMEYWGDKFGTNEDGRMLYTVTLHHQKDDGKNKCHYHVNNRKTSHHLGLDDGEWHVMGWLWDKGYLTTYVDGKEIMTQKWSQDGVPSPDGALVLGDTLESAFAILDSQVMPVTISGAETWPMEVEYLNIWQK